MSNEAILFVAIVKMLQSISAVQAVIARDVAELVRREGKGGMDVELSAALNNMKHSSKDVGEMLAKLQPKKEEFGCGVVEP